MLGVGVHCGAARQTGLTRHKSLSLRSQTLARPWHPRRSMPTIRTMQDALCHARPPSTRSRRAYGWCWTVSSSITARCGGESKSGKGSQYRPTPWRLAHLCSVAWSWHTSTPSKASFSSHACHHVAPTSTTRPTGPLRSESQTQSRELDEARGTYTIPTFLTKS